MSVYALILTFVFGVVCGGLLVIFACLYINAKDEEAAANSLTEDRTMHRVGPNPFIK